MRKSIRIDGERMMLAVRSNKKGKSSSTTVTSKKRTIGRTCWQVKEELAGKSSSAVYIQQTSHIKMQNVTVVSLEGARGPFKFEQGVVPNQDDVEQDCRQGT
mmetsp:Transcript_38103/g.101310  ORF Transcript_38103/g.101310 Transcript_38103/m.101310 type:complete len:102 (+) Transcript_38103:110-415(+)